jgi:hypothetical protein
MGQKCTNSLTDSDDFDHDDGGDDDEIAQLVTAGSI